MTSPRSSTKYIAAVSRQTHRPILYNRMKPHFSSLPSVVKHQQPPITVFKIHLTHSNYGHVFDFHVHVNSSEFKQQIISYVKKNPYTKPCVEQFHDSSWEK